MSDTNKNILPEFQKFLLERKLAPEKNIPFLAYWVSRFLGFARKNERKPDFKLLMAETVEVKKMLISFFKKLSAKS